MASPTRSDLLTCAALAVLLMTLLCGPTLYAQVAAVAPALVPDPSAGPSTTPITASLFSGFWSTIALQWLKKRAWFTVLSEDSTWLIQRSIGILVSFAAATGLHWSYDATVGVLTITGLKEFSWDATWQWSVQEFFYRTTVKPYQSVTTIP